MAGLRDVLGRMGGVAMRTLLPAALFCVVAGAAPVSAQTATPSPGASNSSIIPQSILNRLSPDQIQQLLQNQNQNGPQVIPPATMPQQSVIIPLAPPPVQQEHSELESIMTSRADTALTQFGYDQLANGQLVSAAQLGAVQSSYVLGTGDLLNVSLRGQENSEFAVTVDRDGRVTLPKIAPIEAAGLSFGEFRKKLEEAVKQAYISTKVYVTLTQARQISVLVVGNVRNPGQQTLTGLSTVVDALNLAGGIKKTGTLRDIVVARGGRIIHVDLYSLLMAHDGTPNLTIAQGDRIIVPAIGPTVAIAGSVRRPGIYELPPGRESISQSSLINLGDGPRLPGVYRRMILQLHRNGKEELVDATRTPATTVRNGEILFVAQAVDYSAGKVTLRGSVRLPGLYPLDQVKTLHDLIPSNEIFEPTPYMLLGVVSRLDPQTQQRAVIPFSPAQVIAGTSNMSLMSNDIVQIFTVQQMHALADSGALSDQQNENNGDVQTMLQSTGPATPQTATGTQTQGTTNLPNTNLLSPTQAAIQSMMQSQPGAVAPTQPGTYPNQQPGTYAPGQPGMPSPSTQTLAGRTQPGTQPTAPGTGTSPATAAQNGMAPGMAPGQAPPGSEPDMSQLADLQTSGLLAKALSDYRITLSGAVHDPGPYLAAPGTTLAEVLAAAGGLDTDADTSGFEITSTNIDTRTGRSQTQRKVVSVAPSNYGSVVLHLLDNVDFHHVYTDRLAGSVTVSGQVRYPGIYSLLRGERLSEVLVRAGGLTSVAYPYGTVFLRQSLARQEEEAHQRLALELERQLYQEYAKKAGTPASYGGGATDITGAQNFIDEIRNEKALGRMTVIADPSVLAANPQKDPMMQPGDTIFIPQRPSTVMVIGAVMQPGNYSFSPSATVDDYVGMAGGYDDGAKEDLTFVVYPDGSARRVDDSWLHFNSAAIPPGSVIYVPRDLFPFNWEGLATTLTSLLQSAAVSAASIAVISRNP